MQRLLDVLVPSDTPEATAVARAETAGVRQYRPNTAQRHFFTDQSGVIRFDPSAVATVLSTPIS